MLLILEEEINFLCAKAYSFKRCSLREEAEATIFLGQFDNEIGVLLNHLEKDIEQDFYLNDKQKQK